MVELSECGSNPGHDSCVSLIAPLHPGVMGIWLGLKQSNNINYIQQHFEVCRGRAGHASDASSGG